MISVDTVTWLLSSAVLLADIAVIAGLLASFAFFFVMKPNPLARIVERNGYFLLFLLSFSAVGGSLFYSEVVGYVPCKMCWIQRIFMYPQLLLALLGGLKKDRSMLLAILLLSLGGMSFSLVQYYEQMTAALVTEAFEVCDASGISCSSTPFVTFGFITIPMMALTAFVTNALVSWTMLRRKD